MISRQARDAAARTAKVEERQTKGRLRKTSSAAIQQWQLMELGEFYNHNDSGFEACLEPDASHYQFINSLLDIMA